MQTTNLLLFFFTQNKHIQNTVILMDHHIEQIEKHCRVCGNRLNKSKGKKTQPVHACTDHRDDLVTLVGLQIPAAEEEYLPRNFCNSCFLRMSRVKRAKESGLPFPKFVLMEWTPHQDENCTVRKY